MWTNQPVADSQTLPADKPPWRTLGWGCWAARSIGPRDTLPGEFKPTLYGTREFSRQANSSRPADLQPTSKSSGRPANDPADQQTIQPTSKPSAAKTALGRPVSQHAQRTFGRPDILQPTTLPSADPSNPPALRIITAQPLNKHFMGEGG